MKKFFLIFALIISSNCFSQITLTSAYNPVPGNTILAIGCDTNGITQGNSGANQTWNYAAIVLQDSNLLSFVTPGSTPYGGSFPGANLAAGFDAIDSAYSYFATSSANLVSLGEAAPGIINSYTDPQIFLQYPFTYNNSFTDNFSSTFMSTGFTVYRNGTLSQTCDAWGTLILPTGTFTNAIRLKTISTTRDSSNIGFPIVTVTNDTSYSWWVANRKFSVFEVSYGNVIFNGTPQASFKDVTFSPNNPTIGITQLNTNVPDNIKLSQNYPNPFNPSTKIRFDITSGERSLMSNVKLVVYDELGKEVQLLVNENLSPGSYEVDWNASSVAGGVYYYKLITGNFTQTKKMILIK